jgi:hypothetical protein
LLPGQPDPGPSAICGLRDQARIRSAVKDCSSNRVQGIPSVYLARFADLMHAWRAAPGEVISQAEVDGWLVHCQGLKYSSGVHRSCQGGRLRGLSTALSVDRTPPVQGDGHPAGRPRGPTPGSRTDPFGIGARVDTRSLSSSDWKCHPARPWPSRPGPPRDSSCSRALAWGRQQPVAASARQT